MRWTEREIEGDNRILTRKVYDILNITEDMPHRSQVLIVREFGPSVKSTRGSAIRTTAFSS